jgi:putative ABC transport system permease protein
MGAFLVVEQLVLIVLGAAAGTGLGVGISHLFIPFYHVQIGRYLATPPLVVQIGWREVFYVYAVFGAMFLTAVAVLFLSLRRLRVFEAVKLGETT